MHETVTTLLDALALLLIAAGAAAAVYRWFGWACLAVAGTVLLAGSLLASRRPAPKAPAE